MEYLITRTEGKKIYKQQLVYWAIIMKYNLRTMQPTNILKMMKCLY